MALSNLLRLGVEGIISGYLGEVLSRENGRRGNLTERVIANAVERVGQRVNWNQAGTRSELVRIIRAVNQSQLVARRMYRIESNTMQPLPLPHEYPRLPGTGNRGGNSFTYTVVIDLYARLPDGRTSLTHVVRSDIPLNSRAIEAEAAAAIARGPVVTRQGSAPVELEPTRIAGFRIVSAYIGSPDVPL